jgi:hypothetical protein
MLTLMCLLDFEACSLKDRTTAMRNKNSSFHPLNQKRTPLVNVPAGIKSTLNQRQIVKSLH